MKIKRHGKWVVVCSTSVLWGCTQLSALLAPPDSSAVASRSRAAPSQRPEATRVSAGAVVDQERLFAQGRAAQTGGDLRQAEALYGRLLMLSPRHVGALNGLGVIHAQTERLNTAVVYFGRALAIEPQAAHLHNNLGYALLLGGRLAEAESALRRARELNPASTLTEKNLGLLVQAKARVEAPAVASANAAAQTPTPSGQTLVVVAPSVYELRDPLPLAATDGKLAAKPTKKPSEQGPSIGMPARIPLATLVQSATVKAAVLHGVRLEVSNGVGIRHMARRTAERLAPSGLLTARLTNQPGYRQVKTEIQFSPGQAVAAAALSSRLPLAPALTPVKQLERNIQVRLVLGRDLVGQAIAAWLDDTGERILVLNAEDGWLWS